MEVEPPAFKEYTIYWVSEAFRLVFTNAFSLYLSDVTCDLYVLVLCCFCSSGGRDPRLL